MQSGAVTCAIVTTYSVRDAARILKVSPARLRYWTRTALVSGAGGGEDDDEPEGLDFGDLVCVRGILALLEQGVSLRRIRRTVETLRERVPDLDDPVRSIRVWAEGSPRIVVRHAGSLLEPDGQAVLDFGREAEPSGAVRSLVPEPEPASPATAAEACFARGCELDSDPATYEEAIGCYRQGLELVPDFADCHCNLGAVHYNRGDRAAARSAFERCLEIDPHHVEANFNLANLLEEHGEDHEALRRYKLALAADPLYADLQVNLALLYEKLGDAGQSRRHWRRYLQLEASGAWSEVARKRLDRKDA